MFNELIVLQILLLVTLIYFTTTFNIITIWYLAGLYLVLIGWWLLLDDADIFVGFLWVIDLGVGLIFFIFILHYSTFLHQKPSFNKTNHTLLYLPLAIIGFLAVIFSLAPTFLTNSISTFYKIWFFLISWYDYYDFFFSATVTDLNLLHEIYFSHNSFEFFLINFFLFYGIISSILASFLIKRIFNFLNYTEFMNTNFLTKTNSTYFVRSQDYLKQQKMSAASRLWAKKKSTL